ncbi:MAG: NADH-quinone oxidoreductase subunit N [Limnochordaceae bacterium]|nr:NADH-quinone oxidoreductase subunit N [Limnochordaceae bacterium]
MTDWMMVLPQLLLTAGGLAVIGVDLAAKRQELSALTAGLTLVVAAAAVGAAAGRVGEAWQSMLVVDGFSTFFSMLFLVTGALVVLFSLPYVRKKEIHAGEFYSLLVFVVLGMTMMASSRDLLVIWLGLELLSIGSYVLAGMLKDDPRSLEASLKYFLIGAMTSAVLLFGLSLLYGVSGATHLEAIRRAVAVGGPWKSVALVGMWFLAVGFGFKVAAVPFHMWAPDVYHGAPTPVAALLIAGSEAAAFSALIRVFNDAFAPLAADWRAVFTVLAVATMTYGNAVALVQTSAKRMMAYSAIAQAGYVLVGMAVGTPEAVSAMLYYLLAYAFMVLGTFAVIAWLSLSRPDEMLDDFQGLGRRVPWVAALTVLLMLSFIGIPPTAGFAGKFYLIKSAVSAGMVWLAVVMVVNSAISAGYYYGIVRRMYLEGDAVRERTAMQQAAPGAASSMPLPMQLALVISAAATVLLLLFPQPILDWLGQAQHVVAMLP